MDKELWYNYAMEHNSTLKKKETLLFATTQMNLEDIMLSEINQTQRQALPILTYMWNLKNVELIVTENRMLVTRGHGVGKIGRCLSMDTYF